MKIRVYVDESKEGNLRASADAADVDFITDIPAEMSVKAREQAAELLYKIESSSLDYVRNWSLDVPTTVFIDLYCICTDSEAKE